MRVAGPETEDRRDGPIEHGGNLAKARALFPQAPEPWIDLSTGISPHSYPHSPIPATAFSRLPEPALAEDLARLAAEAYRAPSARHVAAGPGTQMLLPIIASLAGGGGKAMILSPTYAEHARAAQFSGYEVHETGEIGRLAEGQLAVVVNPNNPTGRIATRDELLALAAEMRSKSGLLVVDEAFMDVSEADSVADAVDTDNLVVLRSFGKFYGMAGLRLGFAITHPDTVSRIDRKLGPWAVSGPALHVAREALADRQWQAGMRATLKTEAARLDGMLADAGFVVCAGTSLFRFIRNPNAPALFRHLGEQSILTRRFQDRPDDLRIGLPQPGEWARLEAALKSI